MDYLFDEYGTVIVETIGSMFILTFIMYAFICIVSPEGSQTTPIIYETINNFIKGLIGSL